MDRAVLLVQVKEFLAHLMSRSWLSTTSIPEDVPILSVILGWDSIEAPELLAMIEERYEVSIPNEEVSAIVLSSVNALVDFILVERSRV